MDSTDFGATSSELVQGQLLKYTNVVKGFQYRWFLLDATRGTLEYFMVSQPLTDCQSQMTNL